MGVRKAQALEDTFAHIFWSQREGCYQVCRDRYRTPSGDAVPLPGPLDRRWFDLLFKIPNIEDILCRLVPPEDEELKEKLINYQYRKILEGGCFIEEDVARLREQGWTEWKGFLEGRQHDHLRRHPSAEPDLPDRSGEGTGAAEPVQNCPGAARQGQAAHLAGAESAGTDRRLGGGVKEGFL